MKAKKQQRKYHQQHGSKSIGSATSSRSKQAKKRWRVMA